MGLQLGLETKLLMNWLNQGREYICVYVQNICARDKVCNIKLHPTNKLDFDIPKNVF